MNLDDKIKQWKQLKKSKALIDKRMADIRKDIMYSLEDNEKRAGIQKKVRDMTSYDTDRVWHIMHMRGVHCDHFTKRTIDDDKVEELYFNGTLSDSDIRFIREPKYTHALTEYEEPLSDEDISEGGY